MTVNVLGSATVRKALATALRTPCSNRGTRCASRSGPASAILVMSSTSASLLRLNVVIVRFDFHTITASASATVK